MRRKIIRSRGKIDSGKLVKALLDSNPKVAVTIRGIQNMGGIANPSVARRVFGELRDSGVVLGRYVNPNYSRLVQPLGPRYPRH